MIVLVFMDILFLEILVIFVKMMEFSWDLWDLNFHKNQTDQDKDLKNSLKSPYYMAVKCQEVLGPL